RSQRRLDRYRIEDALAHAGRGRSGLFVHDHDYCTAVLDNDDELSDLSLNIDRLELFIATAWRPPSPGRHIRLYELDGEGPLGHFDVVVDDQLAVWAKANVPTTATAHTHVQAIVRFDFLRSRLHVFLRGHAEGVCSNGPDEQCCGEQSTFQHAIE